MAIHNDREWGSTRTWHGPDNEKPMPDFKDTVLELAMTLGGIVGVFCLLIAIVKALG